jgi:XRE family transcriptional regulator, regulator of sulfur utilization
MNIGDKIRQIRISKGLSQENIAETLKISTSAYGDIERNKTEITVKRLISISKIFGVDPSEFYESNTKGNATDEELLKIKAELLLAQIESHRWKERFLRSLFAEDKFNSKRQKIGFK